MSEHELEWVELVLTAWALWSAAGGVGLRSAMGNVYENWGVPPSTTPDRNCTAHDNQMLDVDSAVRQLPQVLYRPVHCYYRRDLGRLGSARACGVSERTFDGRIKLAHYHVARLLRSQPIKGADKSADQAYDSPTLGAVRVGTPGQ